jgi:dCTP deaminase
MSMLPFRLGGPAPTVVAGPDEFRRDGSAILVHDIDATQLGDGLCNATYDLRIGRQYKDHRDGLTTDLSRRESFTLPPGGAVLIETEEWVHFPVSVFGYITPKVSLLQQGVSNTSSKVDPGYDGPLVITVFNLGKKVVHLHRGQYFCALSLHRIEGAVPYSQKGKRLSGGSRNSWYSFRDFIDRNNATFTVFLTLLSIILIILQIIGRSRSGTP